MPQARALGRSNAGRTNRSLTTPRRPDGTWADGGGSGSSGADTHHQLHRIPHPQLNSSTMRDGSVFSLSSSTPRALAAEQFASTVAPSLNPALATQLARSHALTATAHVPRATVSLARAFPDRTGSAGLDPRPLNPWPYQPRQVRHQADKAAAPPLVPVAVPTVRGSFVPPSRAPFVASPRSAAPVPFDTSPPAPAPVLPSSSLDAAQEAADAPTLPLSGFFPSALSNFGEGSGVAGTRGQRFVSQKGVTDFLSQLAQQGGEGGEGVVHSSIPSAGKEVAHSPASSFSSSSAKADLCFNNIRPETPSASAFSASSSSTAAAAAAPGGAGDSSSSSSSSSYVTDRSRFLRTWAHLPAPASKAPSVTAERALSALGGFIAARRGVVSFLRNFTTNNTRQGGGGGGEGAGGAGVRGGGGGGGAGCSHDQFAQALQRLGMHLPPPELARVFRTLDPTHSGLIDFHTLYRLHDEEPYRQQQRRGGGRDTTLQQQQQQQQPRAPHSHGREEESKESSSSTKTTTAATFQPPATASSISSRPPIPSLSLPTPPPSHECMPPLFQSVYSARTARPFVPLGGPSAAAAGSQSARPTTTEPEYTVQRPRPPPTRFERTHKDMHASGAVGRPISATTRARIDAQRRALHLPPVRTLAHLLHSDSPLPAAASSSSSSPAPPHAFASPDADRFTPRADALREMQQGDRARRLARLSARHHALDTHEQRVLAAYESDALTLQRQAANSILDKVQQKRQYMQSLEINYPQHAHGKRTREAEVHAQTSASSGVAHEASVVAEA